MLLWGTGSAAGTDGTRIHYAHCAASEGEDVVYRSGTPQRDGTITWATEEQTAYKVPKGKNVMYPKLIVGSSGVPWIAFMVYDGGFNQAPYDAVVTKSVQSNGAWQTAPGFPCILVDDNTTAYPDPVGVPLTNGKTFWVYNRNLLDDGYYGREWNGQSWDAEEAVTHSHSGYGLYSLAADGDDVHLVFGGGTIRYRKRDSQTGWGAEFKLTGSGSGHTAITVTGPNSLIVTWLDTAKHVVTCREMIDGQWSAPWPWLDESGDRLANPQLGINLNALVTSSAMIQHSVVYTTGSEPPFTIKFAAWRRTTNSPAASTSLSK